jgi:hypothetical protein
VISQVGCSNTQQATNESSLHWSFLGRSLPCVLSHKDVSSANIARLTPVICGVSFINKLYGVGDRTEPCGTPARIYLGMDILPLNFSSEGNELISLTRLVKNSSLDNLYSKAGCHTVSKAFLKSFVKIKSYMICYL